VSDALDSPVSDSSHSVPAGERTQSELHKSTCDDPSSDQPHPSVSLPVFVEKCSVEDTPRKVALKHKLHISESKLKSSRKKIKLLQQSKQRLLKRNASLQTVIEELRKNNIMSTESLTTLHNCAGGVDDLIQRRDAKLSEKPH